MPKRTFENRETVLLSPEDAEIQALFKLTRSYNSDGSLKYIQVVGDADALNAYAEGRPAPAVPGAARKALALPRLVMQRALGRPLESTELVKPINGHIGDCQRENLELTSRSALVSHEYSKSAADSGQKYAYKNDVGRYRARYNNRYLGSYDSTDQVAAAVELFKRLISEGVSEAEAVQRVKSLSRNSSRITIEP